MEITENTTWKSRVHRDLKGRNGRSIITNGHRVLPTADGRLKVTRRFRDIAGQLIRDAGGPGQCSEMRLQLIRRFAAAACIAEQIEDKLCSGIEIPIEQHALCVSSLVRIARQIGVDRFPRTLVPSLDQYLGSKQLEAAE